MASPRLWLRFSFSSLVSKLICCCLVFASACAPKDFEHADQLKSLNFDVLKETQAYIQSCENALGPIPDFDCNSADSIELTVTKDGAEVSGISSEVLDCDSPSIANLKGRCQPGSRVVVRRQEDVVWVLYCVNVTPRTSGDSQRSLFDNIAILGYRTKDTGGCQASSADAKAGDLCFFSSKNVEANSQASAHWARAGERIDGSKIPAIHSQIRALDDLGFLSNAADMQKDVCVNCHTAMPFIRTPKFHDKTRPGTSLLPDLAARSPYRVVHEKRLNELYDLAVQANEARNAYHRSENPWTPAAWEMPGSQCTQCHRIAKRKTFFSQDEVAQGVGSISPELASIGGPYLTITRRDGSSERLEEDPYLSVGQRSFPNVQWHARRGVSAFTRYSTAASFADSKLGRDADAIRKCLLGEPDAGDCGRERVLATPVQP